MAKGKMPAALKAYWAKKRGGKSRSGGPKMAKKKGNRAKSGEVTKMGILGDVGVGVAAGAPLLIAVVGNGGSLSGVVGMHKATNDIGKSAMEFVDILGIEYLGTKVSTGEKWSGPEAYSGLKMAAGGVALILVDWGLGKLIKGKKPVIPLVNIPLVRGRAKRGWG